MVRAKATAAATAMLNDEGRVNGASRLLENSMMALAPGIMFDELCVLYAQSAYIRHD
jgi:hypothetical protein